MGPGSGGPRAWIGAALAAACLAAGAGPAPAEEARPLSWPQEKCRRYAIAWSDLLARRGRRDLSPDFLESHGRFLASGCAEGRNVCPRSGGELEIANMLTVAAMNAGTASTFLPFACRP